MKIVLNESVLQHKGTEGEELKLYSGQYCLSWHLSLPSMKMNTLESHTLAFPNRKKNLLKCLVSFRFIVYFMYSPAPPWSYGFFYGETPGYCITNITQVLLENLYKFIKLADINTDYFWVWILMQENLREDRIWQVSMWALELAKLLSYGFLGFG